MMLGKQLPKTEPGNANPVLPCVLAAKRFIFQFCSHLYHLKPLPCSLPSTASFQSLFGLAGRAGGTFHPHFQKPYQRKQSPEEIWRPRLAPLKSHAGSPAIPFDKETSRLASQGPALWSTENWFPPRTKPWRYLYIIYLSKLSGGQRALAVPQASLAT